jgi:hypothetical protein
MTAASPRSPRRREVVGYSRLMGDHEAGTARRRCLLRAVTGTTDLHANGASRLSKHDRNNAILRRARA